MRSSEFIIEGKNHPIICVDVQPEYAEFGGYDSQDKCAEIIHFVNNQTGPVLMFCNAEDSGVSNDTVAEIKEYWEDTIRGDDGQDYDSDDYVEPESMINWNRFTVVDKGYGYLRSWMDSKIDPSIIIRVIRDMYQRRFTDSREYDTPELFKNKVLPTLVGRSWEDWMWQDGIQISWISIAQLKRFNGAYIVGGGREECLREVELLMNAFNIRYKRIDSLVY